jgi:hypothetical protein
MKTDNLVMNGNDVGDKIGEFYGTDINEVNIHRVRFAELDDMQQRVRASFGLDSASIELLPGEVVKDNVIRRFTTAEVVGEQFYAPEAQVSFEESITGLKDPDYNWDEPRCA